MASRKSVLTVAALFLFLTAPVVASEARPAPLPDQIVAVLSFKSPTAFLESTDAFLAAILANTPQNYQEGMLPMLAPMFLPPPIVEADLESEAHVLFLAGGDGFERPVFLVGVADYPAFLDAVTPDGEQTETKGKVTRIESGNGMDFYLADAGGKLAVVAMREDDAADALAALQGWRPAAPADAEASMVFAKPAAFDRDGNVADAYAEMLAELDDKGKDLAKAAADRGLDADMVKGSFAVARRWLEALAKEGADLAGGRIDLRLDRENIALAANLLPGEGGMLADVVKKAEALKNEIQPLGLAVGADAGVFVQTAPATAILPGDPERWRKFNVETMRDILPGSEADVSAAFDAFFAAKPGETARAVYDNGAVLDYIRVEDPAKAMAAVLDGYALVDRMLGTFLKEGSDRKTRLVVGDEKDGDFAYKHVTLRIADDSKLRGLAEQADLPETMFNKIASGASLMLATGDKALVMGSGPATPGQLAKAVAAAGGAGTPFVDTPAAKAALERIDHRQIGVGLAKVSSITRILLDNLANDENLSDEGRKVLENVIPDLIVSDELIGIGHGSAGGGYAVELTATAKGVNDMMRNYFLVVEREAALYPDRHPDDDGEYDDLGEERNGGDADDGSEYEDDSPDSSDGASE